MNSRERMAALAKRLHLDVTPAQRHYGRFLEKRITPGLRWLEIGCGRHVVPGWAVSEVKVKQLEAR